MMKKSLSQFLLGCTLAVVALLWIVQPSAVFADGPVGNRVYRGTYTWDNVYDYGQGRLYRETGSMSYSTHYVGSSNGNEIWAYHGEGTWKDTWLSNGQVFNWGWWKTPVWQTHMKKGEVFSEVWINRGAGSNPWVGDYHYRVIFHFVDKKLVVYKVENVFR